ncbi:sulfotransferase [Nocardioides sp. YIM 152588]|uniref:sulfotransferase n=1 Tax=Nocardioides sp. YIM 152588 TaxID=3158259 RepID=UPI0032E4BE96
MAPGQPRTRTTVVYLGGFGRSGSTLVERVLGTAPGWVNIGELVDLARSVAPADELCGCGVPFSACPVWQQVGEVAFGGWDAGVLERLAGLQRAATRQRHLPAMIAGRRRPSRPLTEMREAFARIYHAVAEVTDARVVVDASKGPAFGYALAGAPGVDLRMLNVIRDPRAVAWSWSRQVERPHAAAAGAAGGDEMWRIPASRSAVQWAALQVEVEAIGAVGGIGTARLRYEDFIDDPVATLVAATADAGAPLTAGELPPMDGGLVELGPSHGLSGNPGRFRSGTIELRADDRWVARMPAADRRTVTAVTWPLLKAYRYPAGAGTAPADPHLPETRS